MVVTIRVFAATNAPAVVNSPAANVIVYAPAGNAAVAVVHTIVSVATVIVQGEVSVALPDAGASCPAGAAAAL